MLLLPQWLHDKQYARQPGSSFLICPIGQIKISSVELEAIKKTWSHHKKVSATHYYWSIHHHHRNGPAISYVRPSSSSDPCVIVCMHPYRVSSFGAPVWLASFLANVISPFSCWCLLLLLYIYIRVVRTTRSDVTVKCMQFVHSMVSIEMHV